MTFDPKNRCAQAADADDVAALIAEHGAHWCVDGANVLVLARDAQRWEVLERVILADVPGYLEVLRDCPDHNFVELLHAYGEFFATQESCCHVGTIFPLRMWCEQVNDPAMREWLKFAEDYGYTGYAFSPTPGNPSRWCFEATAIKRIANDGGLSAFPHMALMAAARRVMDAPMRDPGTADALNYLTHYFGPYRASLPDGTVGWVYGVIDTGYHLVELESGGWTIRDDAFLADMERFEEVVFVTPLPCATSDEHSQAAARTHFGAIAF